MCPSVNYKKAYKRCLWLPSWLPSLSSSSPSSPSSSFKYIYRFFILEKTFVNIHIQRCWVGWSSDRLIIHDRHDHLIVMIIWSSNHLIIWSSWSSDHRDYLIIMIIMIIWSSDHLIIWSSDHLIITIIWSSWLSDQKPFSQRVMHTLPSAACYWLARPDLQIWFCFKFPCPYFFCGIFFWSIILSCQRFFACFSVQT